MVWSSLRGLWWLGWLAGVTGFLLVVAATASAMLLVVLMVVVLLLMVCVCVCVRMCVRRRVRVRVRVHMSLSHIVFFLLSNVFYPSTHHFPHAPSPPSKNAMPLS